MSLLDNKVNICCFGEILWDLLPEGPRPGGAPMNVAYHAKKLGIPSAVISSVGKDENGEKLKNLIKGWDLLPDTIQTNSAYDTSTVVATVGKNHEVSYEIMEPVAWDFIALSAENRAIVRQADYFVYGSLAARNDRSRETLLHLLGDANLKVMDINLRPPFYDQDLLQELISKADILKVNESELLLLSDFFLDNEREESDRIRSLKKKFDLQEMIVTKGGDGASYYVKGDAFHMKGPAITVADTVGSGDSFLASFLVSHLKGEKSENILRNAVAMGAFIASKSGGSPEYSLDEYNRFRNTF